ncbi:MAG: EamA family transporter, partial [Candidatus Eisenbacteria bacterium]
GRVNPAYVVAMAASVLYGSADFTGGVASRRASVPVATLTAWLAGLVALTIAAPFVAGTPHRADLAWAVAGGAAGALGGGLLYRALAIGPVGIASPIFCVVGLGLPVVVGLALGERPHLPGVVGLLLAPLSIVLLTADDGGGEPGVARRALVPSLAAGLVIGFFLVFMSRIREGTGMWPLALARLVGTLAALGFVLARRLPVTPPAGARAVSTGAGVLDAAANVAYVYAVQRGSLALVAALVSLAPATTVMLGRGVLHERWHRWQALGLALALAAGVLISLG